MAQFNVGDVFDDKYELLAELGSGGIGTVYKARQLDCNRIVALKILHPHIAIDEEFRIRFMREAQALSRLSHVNIVTVYSLGVFQESTPYMVMEYLPGRSLRGLLNEAERVSVLRCIKIIRDAARGLAHVHKHGIVHRDLKPENILLTDSPEPDTVKLVDFGLARLLQESTAEPASDAQDKQKLTRTGALIGTATYMSPEQCMGHKVDFHSDIYSLCACFYELIVGKRLFDADTHVGIIYQHVNAPVPEIKPQEVDRFTPELNSFMAKGLAKNPEARFASMDEMADALNSIAAKLPGGTAVKVSRKWIAISAVGSCLVLALLVVPFLKPLVIAQKQSLKVGDDDEFKRLPPLVQYNEALKLLLLRDISGLHKADLCISKGALRPKDTITLLQERARHSPAEEAVYYQYKVKELYEQNQNTSPRDRVLSAMLGLSANLEELGLPNSSFRILKYILADIEKYGTPQFLFGGAGKNQCKLLYMRILMRDKNDQIQRTPQAQAILKELIDTKQGPWGPLMSTCLDLGMRREAGELIKTCPDGINGNAMVSSCMEKGDIQLAEDCIAFMPEVINEGTEFEYELAINKILIEKDKKNEAGKRLLAYIKSKHTPPKNRDWKSQYQRFALHLLLCGFQQEARQLLETADKSLSAPGGHKSVRQLLSELKNGSQLARYESIRLLDTSTLSLGERARLTEELYTRMMPRKEWAMRHLAELHCLMSTKDAKRLPFRERISYLPQYQDILRYWQQPQEAIRVGDRMLDQLRNNVSSDEDSYRKNMERFMLCKKAKLLHLMGKTAEATALVDEVERSKMKETRGETLPELLEQSMKVPTPWAKLLECELLLNRQQKAEDAVAFCDSPEQLHEMFKVCCSHRQSKLMARILEKCADIDHQRKVRNDITYKILETDLAYFVLESGGPLQQEPSREKLAASLTFHQAVLKHDSHGIIDRYFQALCIAGLQKQADAIWKQKYFF